MKRKDATVLVGIVLFYVVLEAVGVTCPIKFLTGISCAGCGMSRAWLALLQGDWAGALAYHPLVLLPVPVGALLLFQKRTPKKVFDICMWVCGSLFILVYLFRLFRPGDVVTFTPREGALWRLVAGMLG